MNHARLAIPLHGEWSEKILLDHASPGWMDSMRAAITQFFGILFLGQSTTWSNFEHELDRAWASIQHILVALDDRQLAALSRIDPGADDPIGRDWIEFGAYLRFRTEWRDVLSELMVRADAEGRTLCAGTYFRLRCADPSV